MNMYDILCKKRDGFSLTDQEIEWMVDEIAAERVPDYQVTAWLMAAYLRGLDARETVTLTKAMASSGDMLDLSQFGDFSVDKHSTGGVGDKTSLIVGPIVASLGGKVTKMSGRGLGHTGGTVDKLESIPGYRTELSSEDFLAQIEKVGMAIVGQTASFAPVDKKMYALRDVTATVDNIPLITASIMSKKLAAGSHSIVLDVKVGSGAFMKTPEDAKALATKMVEIGRGCGRNMAALLTDMDSPLGRNVGNALEVIEAVGVLTGKVSGDLRDVCVALATEMVALVFGISADEAGARVEEALTSGAAFAKMKEWVAAQGGDTAPLDDISLFPQAAHAYEVKASKAGYIAAMDAEEIGKTAVLLGAGRIVKEDTIDHAAGIVIDRKVGDKVAVGDRLCTLYSNKADSLEAAAEKYRAAITVSDEKPAEKPLIYDIVR